MKNTKNFLSASAALVALLFVSSNISASENQKPMTKELVTYVLFASKDAFKEQVITRLQKELGRDLTPKESATILYLTLDMAMLEIAKIKANESQLEKL